MARPSPPRNRWDFSDERARHAHDWEWLVGNWDVWHRRLKQRLAGSNEWDEFAGKSNLWLTMNGTRIALPVRGNFKDGVGTFIGDDVSDGKPIKVRSQWSRITATSAHWEQASSIDGGKTWETNWISDFERALKETAAPASALPWA